LHTLSLVNHAVFGDCAPVRRRFARVDPTVDPAGSSSGQPTSLHYVATGQIRWGYPGAADISRMRLCMMETSYTTFASKRVAHHLTDSKNAHEKRGIEEKTMVAFLGQCIAQYPGWCDQTHESVVSGSGLDKWIERAARLLCGATASEAALFVDLAREASLVARHAHSIPAEIVKCTWFPTDGMDALLYWALQCKSRTWPRSTWDIPGLQVNSQELPALKFPGGSYSSAPDWDPSPSELQTRFRIRAETLSARLIAYRKFHNYSFDTEIRRRRELNAQTTAVFGPPRPSPAPAPAPAPVPEAPKGDDAPVVTQEKRGDEWYLDTTKTSQAIDVELLPDAPAALNP
jgi:hypothetical protein